MLISKRWVTVLVTLCQTLIAINLGMALQRWDDGRASSLTVIAILLSVVGLVFIGISQTTRILQKDHAGSVP